MKKEREKQIMEILLKEQKATVKELAGRLYASEPSIRRDLVRLEQLRVIRRIHGGAIINEENMTELKIPFELRELEQPDAKTVIAEKAAGLVRDGDVIMMDSSSSAYQVIPWLRFRKGITVVTNGVKALSALGELGIKTFSTGGQLLPSCLSLVGDDAVKMLENVNADIMFFSCRGLSVEGKITDFSVEEDLVRRKMLEQSKQKVLLVTGDKIGKTYFHNLCFISAVTKVISENPLPPALAEMTGKGRREERD